MKTRRAPLHAFTSLRFVAAVQVVFHHFVIFIPSFQSGAPEWLRRIVGSGANAVALFFVLSGFILTYNYLSADGQFLVAKREYWSARFARIYPMYFVGMCAYLPIAATRYFSGTGHSVVDIGPGSLFLGSGVFGLILLQAWTVVFNGWNPPCWSVSAEAFFYSVFPWIAQAALRWKQRRVWISLIALWALSLIAPAYFLLAILGHKATRTKELWEVIMSSFPLLQIFPFLIGIGTAAVFLRIGSRYRPHAGLIYPTLMAIIFVSVCVPLGAQRLAEHVLTPFYAFLLYLLAFNRCAVSRVLSWAPLVLLGEASYALFVLHTPLWNYMARMKNVLSILQGHFPKGLANPKIATEWNYSMTAVMFCVYLIVLVGLSVLALLFIERPARLYLRRRLGPAEKANTQKIDVVSAAAAQAQV